MTSHSTNRDFSRSITCTHSSSPKINTNKHKTNSLLTSCCTCSRSRDKSPQLKKNFTNDNIKSDVQKGFFKRIQSFKGMTYFSNEKKTTKEIKTIHISTNFEYLSTKTAKFCSKKTTCCCYSCCNSKFICNIEWL